MYTNQQAYITASELQIGYGKSNSYLYQNISFDLYKGELVCLLGANGAGKSTLLRTIGALLPFQKGDIWIDGKEIKSYKEKELSHLMGLVLTDKPSVGGFTVRELVELGRYPYTGFFGQLDKSDRQISEKAMIDVGIIHKSDCYVAELSDGERQKMMIAKALAQQCPVLLLDEPTAFLDVESRIEIMNLLRSLAIEQNKLILLSTHDTDLAFLLADKLWLLSRDSGLKCGITENLILSGEMDHFFKSKTIHFNKESGYFLPNPKITKIVYLNSEGNLYKWIENLLSKFNFYTTENKSEAVFEIIVKSNIDITIEIRSAYQHDTKTVKLSSLEELSKWLRIYR